MRPDPQETADLVTFTEEIFNGKLHFLCSVLGCRFSFKVYVKKVREKATKCFLKSAEILLYVDGWTCGYLSLIFIRYLSVYALNLFIEHSGEH